MRRREVPHLAHLDRESTRGGFSWWDRRFIELEGIGTT